MSQPTKINPPRGSSWTLTPSAAQVVVEGKERREEAKGEKEKGVHDHFLVFSLLKVEP